MSWARGYIGGILLRSAVDDEDIVPGLKEFVDHDVCSRNRLVGYAGFDVRIVRKLGNNTYHLLLLCHKIVRPRDVDDPIAILGDHFLGGTILLFVLETVFVTIATLPGPAKTGLCEGDQHDTYQQKT